jgi:hypothetical protein
MAAAGALRLAFALAGCHNCKVKHRHLVEDAGYTMAAIDDILDRGKLHDWSALYRAAHDDRTIAMKIASICRWHYMYGTSALWLRIVHCLYGDTHE